MYSHPSPILHYTFRSTRSHVCSAPTIVSPQYQPIQVHGLLNVAEVIGRSNVGYLDYDMIRLCTNLARALPTEKREMLLL